MLLVILDWERAIILPLVAWCDDIDLLILDEQKSKIWNTMSELKLGVYAI